GERVAPVLTRLIGVGEGLVGLWMLSGLFLPWCALLQTVLVVTMNAIELTKARDLLLAPLPMVLGNTVLLALAWYAAF
ncbi:MAG: DoxX-like family protein, partial [Polyangia bacterium]